MSYDLLRGLYLGSSSNADTTSGYARRMLHVRTPLDGLVPRLAAEGFDVVVTGNPGDGKSHLVRTLADREQLPSAEIELDLSAVDEASALARWRAAREAQRPFILCGNEGPLTALLPALRSDPALADAAQDLTSQLGRLVAHSPDDLPPAPRRTYLLDLADRSVLEARLIEDAITVVCAPDFYPPLPRARETSAGMNVRHLSASREAVPRLAALLAAAGRRCVEHVGFRHLWAAISFAICAGKATSTLQQEVSRLRGQLGVSPLDNLARAHAQGVLLRSFRDHADPASWPSPQLDEDIWSQGAPVSGAWQIDLDEPFEAPAASWPNDPAGALERHRSIKRIVALFHSAGADLVEAVTRAEGFPTAGADDALLEELLLGARRLYLDDAEEAGAPAWLRAGLPLWVSHTYQDVPAGDRPHVAVACLPASDFQVLRARRPPWLEGALGPPPEVVWLSHRPSGVALRVDPELYAQLRRASRGSGPMAVPELAQRFLARLSGWEERTSSCADGPFAVLDRPRGGLIAAGVTRANDEGISYGGVRAG